MIHFISGFPLVSILAFCTASMLAALVGVKMGVRFDREIHESLNS